MFQRMVIIKKINRTSMNIFYQSPQLVACVPTGRSAYTRRGVYPIGVHSRAKTQRPALPALQRTSVRWRDPLPFCRSSKALHLTGLWSSRLCIATQSPAQFSELNVLLTTPCVSSPTSGLQQLSIFSGDLSNHFAITIIDVWTLSLIVLVMRFRSHSATLRWLPVKIGLGS